MVSISPLMAPANHLKVTCQVFSFLLTATSRWFSPSLTLKTTFCGSSSRVCQRAWLNQGFSRRKAAISRITFALLR